MFDPDLISSHDSSMGLINGPGALSVQENQDPLILLTLANHLVHRITMGRGDVVGTKIGPLMVTVGKSLKRTPTHVQEDGFNW